MLSAKVVFSQHDTISDEDNVRDEVPQEGTQLLPHPLLFMTQLTGMGRRETVFKCFVVV